MRRFSFLGIGAVALAIFAMASDAGAVTLIRLTGMPTGGGTFTKTIVDESPDDLYGGSLGDVGFGGYFAGFDVSIFSAGTTKPNTGSASLPDMHMSVFARSGSIGGTLIVEFLDTDFLAPLGSAGLTMSSGGVGGTGATVKYGSYYSAANSSDPDDISFTLLDEIMGFSSSNISSPVPSPLSVATSYSLMQRVILSHPDGVGSASSLDARLVTPEPSTVLLLGLGLIGLGYYGRKRNSWV